MTKVQIKLTEFSDLVTRYTADFVGRGWLVDQVNALLDDPDCRFVVLTGGPGVGKTAFLAHLAATHPHWPRYFIRRDSRDLLRPGDANTFLLTVGGQLATLYPHLFHPENLEVVVRQRIGHVEADGTAVGARIEELRASPFYSVALRMEQEIRRVAGKTTALEIGRLVSEPRLLGMQDLQYLGLLDPLRLLALEDPEARIVVLVDALDELRYSPAEPDIVRALRELPELPPNLRFVISSRPEAFLERLLARHDTCELSLNVAETDNQADLRTYAGVMVAGDGLGPVLAEEGLSPEAFVLGLLDKAAGNFLYLKSVLSGIQEAVAEPTKQDQLHRLIRVEELPDDLGALYGYFLASVVEWAERRGFGDAAWREYLKPLLGVLAVAQEPLSEQQIVAFTCRKQGDIRDLLRELRQFVEAVDGQQPAYRIYHTSFAEYLLDSEHNRDYWIDGQEAHRCVADWYWGTYHDDWQRYDDYGLNSFAAHLFGSGDAGRLNLISKEWMQARYKGSGYVYTGFLADVDLAWRAALASKVPHVPTMIRLQTARQVVGQQVSRYTDIDLETLVWLGRENEAMAHARLRDEPGDRFRGLLTIYNILKQKGQPNFALLDEAMGVVHALQDDFERARSLCALGTALVQAEDSRASAVFDQAEEAARAILKLDQRASVLCDLAIALVQAGDERATVVFGRTEEAALSVQEDWLRAIRLSELAASLCQVGDNRALTIFDLAREETSTVQNDAMRIWALRDLARAQAQAGLYHQAKEAARKAEEVACAIQDDFERAESLSTLVAVLAQAARFTEAEEVARTISNDWVRASALNDLAVALSRTGDRRASAAFEAAEGMVRAIEDTWAREEALRDLAVSLAQSGQHGKAEEIGRALRDDTMRAYALRQLAAALAQAGDCRAGAVFDEARAYAIPDDYWQAEALRTMAEALTQVGRYTEAEKVACAIQDSHRQVKALCDLATTLAQAGNGQASAAMDEAWRVARTTGDVRVLTDVAVDMAQVGDPRAGDVFQEAEQVARAIQDNRERSEALRHLAATFAQNGDHDKAQSVSDDIEDDEVRAWALHDLTVALAQAQRYQQADALVHTIQHEEIQTDALRELGTVLAQADRYDEAEAIAYTLQDDWGQALVLRHLAAASARAGDQRAGMACDRAREAAHAVWDSEWRVYALSDLAMDLAEVEGDRSSVILDEAEEVAREITDASKRASALHYLVKTFAQAGCYDKAETIASDIQQYETRTWALRDLAVALAQARYYDKAEQIARLVQDRYQREEALRDLAAILVEDGHVVEGLTTLGPCQLDRFLQTLAEWAPSLEGVEARLSVAVLREAANVAGWVRSDWHRIHHLLSEPEIGE